jgi:hypothetical protein
MCNRVSLVSSLFLLFLTSISTGIADNAPRDYFPAPPGTHLLFTSYEVQSGDEYYAKGKKVSDNSDYSEKRFITKYGYYGKIYGWNTVIVPIVGHVSAAIRLPGETNKRKAAGMIDPIFVLGASHALDTEGKWRFGFSNWLTIPLGDYDTNKTINIGGNRWATKPEINLSHKITPQTIIEITGSTTFFSDNDEYTAANFELERKPLTAWESHLSQDFNREWRGSLSYFFHGGGETIINGTDQDNARSDHSVQAGLNWRFSGLWSTGLRVRSNYAVENGVKNNVIRLKLSKLFF